jgi:hypothetical protein
VGGILAGLLAVLVHEIVWFAAAPSVRVLVVILLALLALYLARFQYALNRGSGPAEKWLQSEPAGKWLRSKRGAEAPHPLEGIESTPAQIDLLSLGPPRLRAPGITASQALQEQREERF